MPDNIPTTDEGFKLHVVDALATLKQGQENMSTRLFGGNGQKGVLEYLTEHTKKVEDDSINRDKVISAEQAKLNNKVIWFSGAGTGVGTVLGFIFGKLGIHI